MSRLATLKRRSQFQRVRGGGRWSTPAFVLEGKRRDAGDDPSAATGQPFGVPRFGFTVTKKLGNAVRRSRIRRRLKAAVVATAPECARLDFDYVVVAREPAFDRSFAEIESDLRVAFAQVHRRSNSPARPRVHSPAATSLDRAPQPATHHRKRGRKQEQSKPSD